MMFRAVFWVVILHGSTTQRSTIILHGSTTQKTALNIVLCIHWFGMVLTANMYYFIEQH
jgi:hypothetical protein